MYNQFSRNHIMDKVSSLRLLDRICHIIAFVVVHIRVHACANGNNYIRSAY